MTHQDKTQSTLPTVLPIECLQMGCNILTRSTSVCLFSESSVTAFLTMCEGKSSKAANRRESAFTSPSAEFELRAFLTGMCSVEVLSGSGLLALNALSHC